MVRKHSANGFTLVEMLVVVAIIGILAAIVVPVVFTVLAGAADTPITIEAMKMAEGFERYKGDHGSLPPNFGDLARVNAHLRSAFPRATFNFTNNLDAAEALVFWLRGYGSNPVNPLGGTKTPYFDFDQSRIIAGGGSNGFDIYVPQGGQNAPYIYIHHDSYASLTYTAAGAYGTGSVTAYKSDLTANVYAEPDSFQIISAGQDGDYGTGAGGSFPSGAGYAPGDLDNITNFSEGKLSSKQ